MAMQGNKQARDRRSIRIRRTLKQKSRGRPRLSVFRSHKNISVQVIDDVNGVTVAAASTMEKGVLGKNKSGGDRDAAEAVGKAIAERAIAKGVKEVVFDRGSFLYHGRVKAMADAAREGGLSF